MAFVTSAVSASPTGVKITEERAVFAGDQNRLDGPAIRLRAGGGDEVNRVAHARCAGK